VERSGTPGRKEDKEAVRGRIQKKEVNRFGRKERQAEKGLCKSETKLPSSASDASLIFCSIASTHGQWFHRMSIQIADPGLVLTLTPHKRKLIGIIERLTHGMQNTMAK